MSNICVAHLVRKENGPAPLKAFLDSYKANPAGIAHDLVLILKGFPGDEVPDQYRALVEDLSLRVFFVPEEGFDIPSYLRAIRELDYEYFFLVNSFSVILGENWLGHPYRHLRREGVGAVGATGSYESHYTTNLRRWRQDRSKWFYRGMLANEAKRLGLPLRQRSGFPPFPNPHLRTNAFIIRRELMLSLKVGAMRDKNDGHRFESGKDGLTRQIQRAGLRPIVVGRDGQAYEAEEWEKSRTFRSGEQENLLVSDNQTREYQNAGAEARRVLNENSWGAPE